MDLRYNMKQMVLLLALLLCISETLSKPVEANVTAIHETNAALAERQQNEKITVLWIDLLTPVDDDIVTALCKNVESVGVYDIHKLTRYIGTSYNDLLFTGPTPKKARELLSKIDCYIKAIKSVQRRVESVRQNVLSVPATPEQKEMRAQMSESLLSSIAGYDVFNGVAEGMKESVQLILLILSKEDKRNANLKEKSKLLAKNDW